MEMASHDENRHHFNEYSEEIDILISILNNALCKLQTLIRTYVDFEYETTISRDLIPTEMRNIDGTLSLYERDYVTFSSTSNILQRLYAKYKRMLKRS